MEIIVGGRLWGKTTKMIEMAANDPNISIVVASQKDKERVKRRAMEMGLTIGRIFTFDDVRHGNVQGMPIESKIVMDDADRFIRSFFPSVNVAAITASSDGLIVLPDGERIEGSR